MAGASDKPAPAQGPAWLGCAAGLAFLLIMLAIFAKGCSREPAVGIEAIGAVKARLRNPGSASFDNLFTSRTGAYCGQVNAANGLGGQAGAQRFVYASGVAWLEEDGAGFKRRWDSECAQ